MPAMFALGDKVIADPVIATFAAFGSFAMLLLVDFRGSMSERLLDQAGLNLSYTKIVAPVDGIIGKKNAEPGQQIAAGQQLMAVVPLGDIWVTANFKETQLKRMRPGQPANPAGLGPLGSDRGVP